MARFELTMAGGEKFVVDHPAAAMSEMRAFLAGGPFVVFAEIRVGTTVPLQELLVATGQISLLRPLGAGATQGSSFRAKR